MGPGVRESEREVGGDARVGERPRAVFWYNLPTPYMVERFDRLARRNRVDFEAWFSGHTEENRSWDVDPARWEFSHRYLPSVPVKRLLTLRGPRLDGLGAHRVGLPVGLLKRDPPDVLVGMHAEPAFLFALAAARRRGVKIAVYVEKTFDTWVRRRRWKEATKGQIFSRLDAVLVPGPDAREFALKYGAPSQAIYQLPCVIDYEAYHAGSRLDPAERARVREQTGLSGVTFIYVGRLWRAKGVDHLLDAFAVLQRAVDTPVTLLLVGTGPDEARLRERCRTERIENVVFAGFQDEPSVARLYGASDVFVFPTLGDPYGLVVDEAMAAGLPVVSTTSAGEIALRVDDGTTGFLVPPGNSAALLERMQELASDASLRQRMGTAGSAKASWQSPDRWADAFEAAVFRMVGTTGDARR